MEKLAATHTGRRTTDLLVAVLVLYLAGMLAYDYFARIEGPSMPARVALHGQIIDGSAPYQYRYRVLVPFAAEATARGLQYLPPFQDDAPLDTHPYGTLAFSTAYLLLNSLAISLFLFGIYKLLRTFFAFDLALLGVALSALEVTFTFRDHYFHPWSFWEAALFSIGLLWLRTGHYPAFTIVNVLGVVNRETSAFLCLAFAFLVIPTEPVAWRAYLRRPDVRYALANGLLWIVLYAIIHLLVGYAPPTFTLEDARVGNLARWGYALVLNTLLFGPAWVLVVIGLVRGPVFIRRTAAIIPFYVGLLLPIGYWYEIRYWMTMLPILIPALLAGIEAIRKTDSAYR